MKRLLTACMSICCVIFTQGQRPLHFLSWPCLSPDGQTLVFSYEGDLWKVSATGGMASRLTAMPGYETNARISPDGKWIAFTGRQFGNADIFIMPSEGGDIRQLTWHSATDNMESWDWDSRNLYFSSTRYGNIAGYRLPASGGNAWRVMGDNYYNFDHNLFEHPKTGEIFFNNTWESGNQQQRKRYKGPFNPEIQSWNPASKQLQQYTTWEGKDFGACFDRNGNMYFISDEANGEYNLYTITGNKKTALTRFGTSIKNMQVNANGGKVVFEKDYRLWLYDVKSGQAAPVNIAVTRNYVLPQDKDYEVKGNISAFDVSPDGKKMAFISRGELFVCDAEGKFIRQIQKGNAERAGEIKWLADNKTLLFTQTAGGYYNWFTVAADAAPGTGPKQLTRDEWNNRGISFNKARTKAVYYSGRAELRLMDLKTMESSTIVRDEMWTLNEPPRFSPNGELICFTAMRNFEQDIFLYRISGGQTINLTESGVTEANPNWSPDGNYIYFHTSRLKPSYPFGLREPDIYRLPLEKLDEPFREDKYNELFKTEKKDSARKDSAVKPMQVDMDGLMERMEPVGASFGSQFMAAVAGKADKTTVLYTSNHDEGRPALWKTVLESFEAPKTEKISGAESGNIRLAESGDKWFLLMGGNIFKLNLDGSKTDPVNISFTFRRSLQQEFEQMFDEAWAAVETNFYDEKFHGLNWKKTREQYRAFLPYVNNRADLRVLLNDMLGELNSSHQGFNTFGDDEKVPLANATMETGLLFNPAKPFTVTRVIKRSPADKKGVDIKPGDEVVSVNGMPVDQTRDINAAFTRPSADREITLGIKRGTNQMLVKIHPQTSVAPQLQDEWIDDCQERVNRLGNNRIGYHCMKNMGTGELDKFIIDMTLDFYRKEAMILDLRYNTGGNVHDDVLKFLMQKTYLRWKFRDGQLTGQSNFNPADKPIVLLINEQSLSDAEMTAQGFKQLQLGTIIGMPTYRWIIFTSGTTLVDGSAVRLPSWGCYGLDGRNLESTGVEPDIKVPMTMADRMNGNDPQLERAVQEIMKQLKK